MQDLFDKQLILGDTGPGTGTRSYPKVLNELLGMKFKLVGGFPSSADVFLAMERGEVEGICESLDSVKNRRPDWIRDREGRDPVPGRRAAAIRSSRAFRSCSTSPAADEQRQAIEFLYAGQGIGRPFVAPPDLPPERLKMLRDAFNATMKDADFVADDQEVEARARAGGRRAARRR